MDRGAWQATVCGVAESDTTEQLTHTLNKCSYHTHTHTKKYIYIYIFLNGRKLTKMQIVSVVSPGRGTMITFFFFLFICVLGVLFLS